MVVKGWGVSLTALIRNVHEFSHLHPPPGLTPSRVHPYACTHAQRLIIQILISAACTCDSDKKASASNSLAGNKSLW